MRSRKKLRPARMARSPRSGRRRPVVLVVEDDVDTRELYVDYLSFHGFRVVAVPDGLSAIGEATDLLPDLIIMDLVLPQLDGWQVARQLRAQPATARIPILACTAHAFRASAERALAAGCDAYIVKPCAPEDLLAEIRTLLARPRATQHRRA